MAPLEKFVTRHPLVGIRYWALVIGHPLVGIRYWAYVT